MKVIPKNIKYIYSQNSSQVYVVDADHKAEIDRIYEATQTNRVVIDKVNTPFDGVKIVSSYTERKKYVYTVEIEGLKFTMSERVMFESLLNSVIDSGVIQDKFIWDNRLELVRVGSEDYQNLLEKEKIVYITGSKPGRHYKLEDCEYIYLGKMKSVKYEYCHKPQLYVVELCYYIRLHDGNTKPILIGQKRPMRFTEELAKVTPLEEAKKLIQPTYTNDYSIKYNSEILNLGFNGTYHPLTEQVFGKYNNAN